jgi:uncharacterized protein with PIN domain
MATRKASVEGQIINRGSDAKFTGDEPTWTPGKTYTQGDLMRAFNWYNYLYGADKAQEFMVYWLNSKPKRRELAKKLKSQKKLGVANTYGWLARMITMGYPAPYSQMKKLAKAVREAEAAIVADTEPKIKTPEQVVQKPTIQDFLREKTAETLGELEGRFDDFVADTNVKANAFALLKERNTPQAQVGKIVDFANKRIAEFTEVQNTDDKELKEAYSNFGKVKLKAVIKFFESVVADCQSYVTTKKAVKKPRKAKAKSVEKIVSKVKYMKADTGLQVTSVNPAQMVGATEVWVFNTKTRKLGKYIADATLGPIGVKGTSLTGFDEAKSVAKTLRKPAEQLKALLTAGKIQIRKFMDGINAVEVKLTGRLNEDTLIVKVVK